MEVIQTMTRIIESVEDSPLIKSTVIAATSKTNVTLRNRFVITLHKWRIPLMRKRLQR